MSFRKLVVTAALALLVLSSAVGFADTAARPADKGSEKAIFAVPGLGKEAIVKSLTSALAKEAGVLAAKADAAGGKFVVTFEPGKTGVEALSKIVAGVVPQAKLEKVEAADQKAAKPDCGKCPSKAKCAKEG